MVIRKELPPSKMGFSSVEGYASYKAPPALKKPASLTQCLAVPLFHWEKDSRHVRIKHEKTKGFQFPFSGAGAP